MKEDAIVVLVAEEEGFGVGGGVNQIS